MNHFYHTIVGFADNCRSLYTSEVNRAQDGDIFVEVGVCLGRSLAFLAVEAINSGKDITMYGVDHWEGDHSLYSNIDMLDALGQGWEHEDGGKLMYNTCAENLKPVSHVVNLIVGDSAATASKFDDGTVAFAFIDAGHGSEDVRKDLDAWWPKIKRGGVMGGDDYHISWQGVISAVNDFVAENKLRFEELEDGTWRIRKP